MTNFLNLKGKDNRANRHRQFVSQFESTVDKNFLESVKSSMKKRKAETMGSPSEADIAKE